MSREYTQEEVQNIFLDHVRGMVDYWSGQEGDEKTKLEGLAFSILVAIDGGSAIGGFILAPLPHKDDKEYNISEGNNYYSENHLANVNCDIAGGLHELLFKK